jgi:hypothetical protein
MGGGESTIGIYTINQFDNGAAAGLDYRISPSGNSFSRTISVMSV